LEHRREIPGRRSRIDRALISVLIEEGNERTVIEVGVGEDNSVELSKRVDLGNIKVRGAIGVVGFLPTIDKHAAVRGGE
jgi:hypothetical protein